MTHILAISPHLDDAAFSVGGLLAAHAAKAGRVTIATCFTGNVSQPSGFALACQLDKGLGAEVDYMALRRAEDRAACAVIGAEAIHLPFLEAPHRGYGDAAALFGARHDTDLVLAPLTAALRALVDDIDPNLLLGPLGIGNHVDHGIVRDALQALGRPLLLWEDWPYLQRAEIPQAEQPARRHRLSDADRAARLAMCQAYASQLGFQFGGAAALEQQIAAVSEERLHLP